jgi:hypothetical protein
MPKSSEWSLYFRFSKQNLDCIKELSVIFISVILVCTRVYPKVSGLAAWSENCKWYSSLPLGAVV